MVPVIPTVAQSVPLNLPVARTRSTSGNNVARSACTDPSRSAFASSASLSTLPSIRSRAATTSLMAARNANWPAMACMPSACSGPSCTCFQSRLPAKCLTRPDEAAEIPVLRRDGPVLLQQLQRPLRELEVLAVRLAVRSDVRGELKSIDHQMPRLATDLPRREEHLIDEGRHRGRRALHDHALTRRVDLDRPGTGRILALPTHRHQDTVRRRLGGSGGRRADRTV